MSDMSEIRNDTTRNRFELDVDGEIAFATYRRAGGVITFLHTETPPHLRGRGIASRLIRGAFEQVRAEGLKVRAFCPFVADYIAAHPEFADLS